MNLAIPLEIQAALAALVVTAAVYDLRSRRIPNWLNLAGVIAGLGLNAWHGGLEGLRLAGVGLVAAFAINLLLYIIHALGAGDVKLLAAVGAMLGFERWVWVYIFIALAGGVLGVVVVVIRGRVRKTFWNVMFLAGELARFRAPYLRQEELDVKSEKALRLPRGVSIAVGTLAYLVWIGMK
jgi:prepilin peptidase CpaA